MQPPSYMRERVRRETPFGTLRVLDDTVLDAHALVHGETLHGWQFRGEGRLDEPTGYYTAESPVAELFRALPAGGRVAVAGLGVGVLAALAPPGASVTFYEIDPAVIELASDPAWFSFLARSRARCEVVRGDALTALRGAYDLVVLDAFFGDAVADAFLAPAAVARFAAQLRPGGALAFHVTSTARGVDHRPSVARAARGLACASKDAVSAPTPRDPTLALDEAFDLSAPVETRWVIASPDVARVDEAVRRAGWSALGG